MNKSFENFNLSKDDILSFDDVKISDGRLSMILGSYKNSFNLNEINDKKFLNFLNQGEISAGIDAKVDLNLELTMDEDDDILVSKINEVIVKSIDKLKLNLRNSLDDRDFEVYLNTFMDEKEVELIIKEALDQQKEDLLSAKINDFTSWDYNVGQSS